LAGRKGVLVPDGEEGPSFKNQNAGHRPDGIEKRGEPGRRFCKDKRTKKEGVRKEGKEANEKSASSGQDLIQGDLQNPSPK